MAYFSLFSFFSIILSGCGQADYEASMKSQYQALERGSGFLEALFKDPNDVLGGAASLQLPTYINEEAKVLRVGQRTRNGSLMSAARIQPPGMDIPGFDFTYELFLKMEGVANMQPMYWHFGSAPADTKLKTIENKLRAGAAKAVPKSKPGFVDASVSTPDGGTLRYRKMTVRGTQSFSADPDTNDDFENKPGELRVYIHTAGDRHVIIAMRGTDEVIQQLDAMNKAEFALGTLSVSGGGGGES